MSRISFNEYFKEMAELVATRSTCPRLHVGCVLVKNGRVISTGYNGSISGTPQCDEVGCEIEDGHCVRAVHAEQNALMQCAQFNGGCDGSVAYVTHYPCKVCMKLLLSAGIKGIYYINGNLHSDSPDELDKEITNTIVLEKLK
jgi:dCMP deaminase